MNRTITFLMSISILLCSCAKTTVIDPYFFGNGMEEIHIKASIKTSFPESKTFRIIDAYIDANLLYLQIEYRSTCSGKDNFKFTGTQLYYDDSGNAHREARLIIDIEDNENCDLTKDTKIIDLRALTSLEERDAETTLHVGGWRTAMTYVFIPHRDKN